MKTAEYIPALLNLTQSVVYTYSKSWCDTQYIYTKHIKVEKSSFILKSRGQMACINLAREF